MTTIKIFCVFIWCIQRHQSILKLEFHAHNHGNDMQSYAITKSISSCFYFVSDRDVLHFIFKIVQSETCLDIFPLDKMFALTFQVTFVTAGWHELQVVDICYSCLTFTRECHYIWIMAFIIPYLCGYFCLQIILWNIFLTASSIYSPSVRKRVSSILINFISDAL